MVTKKNILLKKPKITDVKKLYDILGSSSKYYKLFCVLYTATSLNLFDNLEEFKKPKDLSDKIGTHPRLTHILCEVLSNIGLLNKKKDKYKNTKIAELFLKTDSDYSQIEVIKNLYNGFKIWERLPSIMKSGPLHIDEEDFFEDNLIHALAAEILTGELQDTVNIVARLPEFQKARKLLDLGGGHGLYSIAFTTLNPNLKAYVFDFPNVIKDTRKYLETFNADRVKVIEGNFFVDDIGSGYDIIFFSYNPGGKNPKLVPKIHKALNDGGIFITKHAFYKKGEGSKDPLLDLEWNLTKFEGVKKKDKIYSFEGDLYYEDYLELLKKYFSIVDIVESKKFSRLPLYKFGDVLDSKIIICKKQPN
ncbi:O-methyltransferase family 2 [Methanothermus fervidus DSM 2088]|uniref:O-methyltransferase family 2 n=1 Tax=Methanothermus fervidus (strain ATCC 43054 / DSM 2088 / JCM 10308 / V24 S) TaxID=523846 RepID=E3GYI1_METFV|nr:O-methyltransferase family 2 [Methanothermus fervidus DSM 2088]